jgi:hypothetical protein
LFFFYKNLYNSYSCSRYRRASPCAFMRCPLCTQYAHSSVLRPSLCERIPYNPFTVSLSCPTSPLLYKLFNVGKIVVIEPLLPFLSKSDFYISLTARPLPFSCSAVETNFQSIAEIVVLPFQLYSSCDHRLWHAVAYLVEALSYKPECCGFYSQCGH